MSFKRGSTVPTNYVVATACTCIVDTNTLVTYTRQVSIRPLAGLVLSGLVDATITLWGVDMYISAINMSSVSMIV